MKKRTSIFICVLLLTLSAATSKAYAYLGVRVNVRIEGASQTLASGTVSAYTFREALELLASNNGLTLTFAQSGLESSLFSIKGIQENSAYNDGKWMGYILRGKQIIRQENYLSLPLINGDEIVLYYGDPDETLLVTHFSCEQIENELVFYVGVTETDWTEEEGSWAAQSHTIPVEGVGIHVAFPETERVLVTGEDGRAQIAIPSLPGAAVFYAEGYRPDKAPLIVKTGVQTVPCGFRKDMPYVTRAEAAAFVVHMYGLVAEEDELWPSESPNDPFVSGESAIDEPEAVTNTEAATDATDDISNTEAATDATDDISNAEAATDATDVPIENGSISNYEDQPDETVVEENGSDLNSTNKNAAEAPDSNPLFHDENGVNENDTNGSEQPDHDDSAAYNGEQPREAETAQNIENEFPFHDIDRQTAYIEQIVTAARLGVVLGYEDATFKPDIPISLMELCVLMMRLSPAFRDEAYAVEELPEWASYAAGSARYTGLLKGINLAWEEPVTPEVILRFYINLCQIVNEES